MRKTLTALALWGGLAVSTGTASAATVLRSPQVAAEPVTTVQYYGGGYGDHHRFWRHERWRRHMMHRQWRAEHGYYRGY